MSIPLEPGGLPRRHEMNRETVSMLAELQSNILKPHVRDHLVAMFFRFETAEIGKRFLAAVAGLVKSASQHLDEIAAFDASKGAKVGRPYVGVGLTYAGYRTLEIEDSRCPADPVFRRGMTDPQSIDQLCDPNLDTWEAGYQRGLHAVVLIAAATVTPGMVGVASGVTAVANLCRAVESNGAGATLIHKEIGTSLQNADGDSIEHFGYVDGRGQPLFLREDIEAEYFGSTGTSIWDPDIGLGRLIVRDPAAPNPDVHRGSYLVFRKLEQNVKAFKRQERDLADRLRMEGEDEERAGALIVGRFEDGTPLAMQSAAGTHHPVPNDFDYRSDPNGLKCPLFAHVRLVNPRDQASRKHLMARRGVPYGNRRRDDQPNDGKIRNKPTKGVGLLFMAFNADLAEQFVFTQAQLANGTSQPMDLLIGQGGRRSPIHCPTEWGSGDQVKVTRPIEQTVTMKGGEYFFMPSIAFLREFIA